MGEAVSRWVGRSLWCGGRIGLGGRRTVRRLGLANSLSACVCAGANMKRTRAASVVTRSPERASANMQSFVPQRYTPVLSVVRVVVSLVPADTEREAEGLVRLRVDPRERQPAEAPLVDVPAGVDSEHVVVSDRPSHGVYHCRRFTIGSSDAPIRLPDLGPSSLFLARRQREPTSAATTEGPLTRTSRQRMPALRSREPLRPQRRHSCRPCEPKRHQGPDQGRHARNH